MKINFTEKSIKALTTQANTQTVYDSKLAGFQLTLSSSGTIVFYFRYRDKASNSRPNIKLGKYGEITLSQARAAATTYAGEVAKGNNPKAEIEAKLKKLHTDRAQKLSAYIDEHYKPWVLSNKKSGVNTLKIIDRYFSHLLDRPMSHITALEIEKWQLSELKRGIKASTVNRNLNALKGILSRAYYQEFIDVNPLSRVKKLKEVDSNKTRFLSNTEKDQLFTALHNRTHSFNEQREQSNQWRAARGFELLPLVTDSEFMDHLEPMVIIAMYTGIRRGELFQLKWEDIDFKIPNMTIKAENAKSSKSREIPLCETAYNALLKWHNQSIDITGYIFKKPQGERFTEITYSWSNLIESAGIENFRFHDLRHHFASQLAMKDVNMNVIRVFLGHADLKTTNRYAHLAQDHKAEAIRLLDNP